MITLKEALAHMDSGKPFSLKVVAFDKKRRSGGQILEYPEAVLLQSSNAEEQGKRGATRLEQLRQQAYEQASRKPNHGTHFTRNIQLLQDGHPIAIVKKIHPALLLEFNGQEVFI